MWSGSWIANETAEVAGVLRASVCLERIMSVKLMLRGRTYFQLFACWALRLTYDLYCTCNFTVFLCYITLWVWLVLRTGHSRAYHLYLQFRVLTLKIQAVFFSERLASNYKAAVAKFIGSDPVGVTLCTWWRWKIHSPKRRDFKAI